MEHSQSRMTLLSSKKKIKPGTAKTKKKRNQVQVEDIVAKYSTLAQADVSSCQKFSDFPLSDRTLDGLEEGGFTEPTEIQRDSLPFSLTGSDLVAAAKTGSGKTLALVIPLLECLWRSRWSRNGDGLGALIISPTRELALQTFTTINKIGRHHDFSCALLIGGTDVNFEKRRLGAVNIVVCTPGRLLQHMDENENFQSDNLQILVIDEADRILDMGFKQQINAIVENLPKDRQSLLFSATQTKDVKELSRVCAKDPVFVSVHEKAETATPEKLKQFYMVCPEEEKVNMVWSFITHHRHSKMLVFVSSCKQARFLTEAFCHLRPGTSLMGLWGTMKQTRRISIFETFEKRKSACLIATDVASRGLDFSGVDWVLQMDAPATVDDYIHRVGRTARMLKTGQALLLLTDRQTRTMKEMLTHKRIPISAIQPDPKAITDIRPKLQVVLAQFPELNQLGQKSVVAYLRSVYLMSNKNIFDVDSIDAKAVAESLGLASIKRIRFLQKKKGGQKDAKKEEEKQVFAGSEFGKEVDDVDDNLFTIKKKNVFNVLDSAPQNDIVEEKDEEEKPKMRKKQKVLLREKEAMKIVRKKIVVNKKVIYDEEGEKAAEEGPLSTASAGLDLQKAIKEMPSIDQADKAAWRAAQKEARKEKKRKEKEAKKSKKTEREVVIGGDSDEEGSVDLSWLPDPDNPRMEESDEEREESPDEESEEEPAKKRRRRNSVVDAEAKALALLSRR